MKTDETSSCRQVYTHRMRAAVCCAWIAVVAVLAPIMSAGQPVVAHGYEFAQGVDSALWVDISAVSDRRTIGYHWPNVAVELPFVFTLYNRSYSEATICYDGTLLFGNQTWMLGKNYVAFPFERDMAGVWGLEVMNNRCLEYRVWCSPPDSTGNRLQVFQFAMGNEPPFQFIYPRDTLLWQVQLYEGDNSVTLVYRKMNGNVPPRVGGRVGLQFGLERFIAVSPAYTSLWNVVWTTIDDSVTYTGWPGNHHYYRFAPVDTVCHPPDIVGTTSRWDTPDSVMVVWHGSSGYDEYRVEYGPMGFAPGTGTGVVVEDTALTMSGLVAGEDYEVYVSARCGDSLWSAPAHVALRAPCDTHALEKIRFFDLGAAGVLCRTGVIGTNWSMGVVDSGSLSPYSRHTVHTNALERDPHTRGQLRCVPEGHCASVRLGNWRVRAEREAVSYTFQVDTDDYDLLVLRYALVEENPNHSVTNNPQFEFEITDANGVSMGSCYHGLFVSGDLSGWDQGVDDVLWRDWEAVGVDLAPMQGQTIVVTLSNRDCAQDGHFGYGYFTLEGAHKHFRSTGCGGLVENTIFAPEGFSYRWYSAAEPTATLSTADSLSVSDTGLYCCQVSHHLSGAECSFVMTTYTGTRYPVSAFDRESDELCGVRVHFMNRSVIARDSAHTELTPFPCEQYLWVFDDGTTSAETHPVHEYNTDGLHWVKLYAMLAEGACVDSVVDTFYLVLERDTVFDTVCAGEAYVFHNERIMAPGWHYYLDSCVGHVLYLHHWPKYDVQVYDTLTIGEVYEWEGKVFAAPVRYSVAYTTRNGCDSLVTLHLSSREEHYRTVCSSELPYEWEGVVFTKVGTDTLYRTSCSGTDSLVVLHLAVRRPPVCSLATEPFCTDAGGYRLMLEDSVCYSISSFPTDSSIPSATIVGGSGIDTLLLSPDTTTVYYLTADYCDTLLCPLKDTICLEPVLLVEARMAVEPPFLTEMVREITAVDGSVNATSRQWFVDSVFLTDNSEVLHYRVEEMRDSVIVMLVANNDFCVDTAWATVLFKVQRLWFPNVFTPDLPTNNRFRGYGMNVKDYDLQVFTRWGDCIFHTKNLEEGWDGTYRGVKSPESAYAYLCHYTTLEGKPEVMAGTVTLVR